MTDLNFEFTSRPVVLIDDRRFVLLDDIRPRLGVQLVAAAEVSSLIRGDLPPQEDHGTIAVWYDGSDVCYVREGEAPARRVRVTDLPMRIGLDVRGGLTQLLQPA